MTTQISCNTFASMKLIRVKSHVTCNSTFALHSVSLLFCNTWNFETWHVTLKLNSSYRSVGERWRRYLELGSWNTHLATFSEFQPGLDTNRRASQSPFCCGTPKIVTVFYNCPTRTYCVVEQLVTCLIWRSWELLKCSTGRVPSPERYKF